MKILGIDPGLNATGYGLVVVAPGARIRVLEAGSIEPKHSELIQNRIYKVHYHLDALLRKERPDCVVLEKLYAHYKHPITAAIMGHVRGAICLLCAQHDLKLVEESPKRVRKALTGNGNASKEQTRRFVAQLLKIGESQMTLDTSDALALALGYAHMLRFKLL